MTCYTWRHPSRHRVHERQVGQLTARRRGAGVVKRLTTGMVRNFAKRGGMGRYFIEMNDCNKGVSGVYDYFHGRGGGLSTEK